MITIVKVSWLNFSFLQLAFLCPIKQASLFFKVIVQRFRTNKFAAKTYVPPTFSEFVQFVVNEDLNDRTMDVHWEPVYKFCTPCQFQFTDIVKMETFDQDQDHIFQKVGIKDDIFGYEVPKLDLISPYTTN